MLMGRSLHHQTSHITTNHVRCHSDGKADYIWTEPRTGASTVWLNNYPNSPRYLPQPEMAKGVGVSVNLVRYAYLQKTGRASYVALDPNTGSLSAWLYGCPDSARGSRPLINQYPCISVRGLSSWRFHSASISHHVYRDGSEVCKFSDSSAGGTVEVSTLFDMTCDGDKDHILVGSIRGGYQDKGWYYRWDRHGIARDLKVVRDAYWAPDCYNGPVAFKCTFETWHSRDKCGMELPPIKEEGTT